MATWRDGPEYAPHERPRDFSAPTIAPLTQAAAYPAPSAGAPLRQPTRFDAPRDPGPELADVVPAERNPRDPQAAYEIAAASITSADSVWGATATPAPDAARDPLQPMLVSSRPGDDPAWVGGPPAPEPGLPASPPAPVVGVADVLRAVGVPVLLMLGLSILIGVIAPVGYATASFLSARITPGRRPIRGVFLGGVVLICLVGLIALADQQTADVWWGFVGMASQVVSVLTVVAVLLIVWSALRNGEAATTAL